jgi:hypothetical protein
MERRDTLFRHSSGSKIHQAVSLARSPTALSPASWTTCDMTGSWAGVKIEHRSGVTDRHAGRVV